MNFLDNLAAMYVRWFPSLKRNMHISRMAKTAEEYAKQIITITLLMFVVGGVFTFMFVDKFPKDGVKQYGFIPLGMLGFAVMAWFVTSQAPYGYIQSRAREINKEILFAGRYLLIKLESGEALFNALIDTSESYGVAAKYFREIVDDINTGTPIEDALQNALDYNASPKLKRILWQLLGALKTGAEVTTALKSVISSITAEQVVEIKEYGRKLNSFMMFYLVIAIVGPSLGLTMLVILSSFLSLQIPGTVFIMILFFLVAVQGMFVILIKSSRPMVNL